MKQERTDSAMNWSKRIVALFIDSKITPIFALAATLIGVIAIGGLPREEEPQINVTMIDLRVDLPATPATEVEQRACRPLEKFLKELPGVEYVYSTSLENQCLVSLRFYVGYSPQQAVIEARSKVDEHRDLLPTGAEEPLITVRNIDDVAVLSLTLWSEQVDSYLLRRLAAQLCEEIKGVEDVSNAQVIGGQRREVRVYPTPSALQAHRVMPSEIVYSLKQGNYPLTGGSYRTTDSEIATDSVASFRSAEDVRNAELKNYDMYIIAAPKPPLRLGDIAEVVDGPGEPDKYVHFGYGKGADTEQGERPAAPRGRFNQAVTISVAKLPGTSAADVATRVMETVRAQEGRLIPADVHLDVTRNYGRTATEKSNELLWHMGLSVFSVTLLIGFFLGWRESMVVAVAIPVTLALTLSGFYFLGYTLNRITLFALIFSIGILVDDPIVDIENIVRHMRMKENRGRAITHLIMDAVNEVRRPLILATLAVIVAILPMSAVRGLMGPYMRPIPVGATIAMFSSMLVSFVITPWASARWLKAGEATALIGPVADASRSSNGWLQRMGAALSRVFSRFGGHNHETDAEGKLTTLYRHSMEWVLSRPRNQWLFCAGSLLLLLAAVWLFPAGWVQVKMLPFDNKNEFQVILDMPEGTTLERTDAVAREIARTITGFDEVRDVETYSGVAAPYNFNGLIRRYYLRGGSADADLQVNLIDRHERTEESHDIAKRVRDAILPIANRHSAKLKVAEVPPGPPVQETLVAEVYGPTESGRIKLARDIETIFRHTEGVVDVDNCLTYPQRKLLISVDPTKAALNHIDPEMCSDNLAIGLNGRTAGVLHASREREQVDIKVRMPESERSSIEGILSLPVRGRDLRFIPLGEMMKVAEGVIDQKISHKNLMPVSYVLADVAGVIESPGFAIQKTWDRIKALTPNIGPDSAPDIVFTRQPLNSNRYAIKWDGEMHVTYEVFRDLGLAFAVALGLIYVLMVGWFDSYQIPLIIMAVIPGSLIGILPAHALMGAFFSATSMIGFIAGAGIVVRNSIILVDFIQLRLAQGLPLKEAVVDAGAIRFRPMVLTALAVVVGSAVILMDPIFQGMAISLMAGEIASLLIGRAAVPIIFYMVNARNSGKVGG